MINPEALVPVTLKPCPWCDTVEYLLFTEAVTLDRRNVYAKVICTNPAHHVVDGPTVKTAQSSINPKGPVPEAEAAWNTRAHSAAPASGKREGPYADQAEAWNAALENAAEIVERYNAGFADPECGHAPEDIRRLKRPVSPPSSDCGCGMGVLCFRKSPTAPASELVEEVAALAAGFWLDLSEKDDRTSPEDYPDMCLITQEELGDMLSYAHANALRARDAEVAAWLRGPAFSSRHPEDAAFARHVANAIEAGELGRG